MINHMQPETTFKTMPRTLLNTITSKSKMLEHTLPAKGLISVHEMAERLNIKEDKLLKSLERYSVPILKLSDDRKGWFVNLRTLDDVAYGNE